MEKILQLIFIALSIVLIFFLIRWFLRFVAHKHDGHGTYTSSNDKPVDSHSDNLDFPSDTSSSSDGGSSD